MSDTVNGELIQLARESRGHTQKRLAELSSISQGNISKFERGDSQVSPRQLQALAQALDYPTSFFYQQPRLFGFGISSVYHRKRKSIPALTLKKIQAEFNIRALEVERLLAGAEIQSANEFHHLDIEDFDCDAEHIAELLRAQWKLPLGPVKSVIGAIESAGGIVFKYALGSKKLDAQSYWNTGLPPIFFVNKNIPPDRLRFTLAHEIGHIVMHRIPTPNIEDEANQFASAFLMPRDDIISELTPFSLQRALSLKAKWKVSIAALIMRAFQLGAITEFQKRRSFTYLSAAGYRTQEPVAIPDEQPTILRSLLDIYHKDMGYGIRDLCTMLRVNQNDFRARYLDSPLLRVREF